MKKLKHFIKNNKWLMLLLLPLIFVIIYFIPKKGKTIVISDIDEIPEDEKSKRSSVSEQEIKKGFDALLGKYPPSFCQDIEALLRIESGHFKSGQFQQTGSAGMVSTSRSLPNPKTKKYSDLLELPEPERKPFPYGWGSLKEYFDKNYIPYDRTYLTNTFNVWDMNGEIRPDAGKYIYVGFDSFTDALLFMAWNIKTKKNGDVLAWGYGTDKTSDGYKQYKALHEAVKRKNKYTI